MKRNDSLLFSEAKKQTDVNVGTYIYVIQNKGPFVRARVYLTLNWPDPFVHRLEKKGIITRKPVYTYINV